MIQRNKILIAVSFCFAFGAHGMNLLMRPYDTLLLPEVQWDGCYEYTMWLEGGVRPGQAYNSFGNSVNVLEIWNPNQDALAMLDGFPADSPMNQLRIALDATDDDVRGHLLFDGNMNLDLGAVIGARWHFLPHTWLTAYVPFYKARLGNVNFVDLTLSNTAADLRVKNLLTSDLATVVSSLGDGLMLTGWKRSGPGDVNLLVEWLFNFPQERPVLKNVELDGRVGFTLPTGLKADEDQLFAFPFGYDGAVGLVYGGGLKVTMCEWLKGGFDVQLLHLFGNTRNRRIKTSFDQTELLLLAKTPAYKDYGLTQRFNLFIQGYQLVGGLSLLAGYQFLKRGEDHLALNSCDFSTNIANTAPSLDEWIVHEIECVANYDFRVHMSEDTCIAPQASLFARIPFNGTRSVAFTTVGCMIAVDF